MKTYMAIDFLKSKKVYYGSSTDPLKRQKQHLTTDFKSPFHDALRSRQFYWVISEDDGLDDRSEEQFYIDFYHSSEWCYNLSQHAVGGNNILDSRKWITNGVEERFVPIEEHIQGWEDGRLEWGQEQKEARSKQLREWEENPFRKGTATGKRWANNGEEEQQVFELPKGWEFGRLKFHWKPGPKRT
jgi:hypothetical protein